MNDVARILRDAAERIQRNGWCQGGINGSGEDGPKRCIMRACSDAFDALDVRGRDRRILLWEATRNALIRFTRAPRQAMSAWNDARGRTVVDVLAALRGAAAEMEVSCV